MTPTLHTFLHPPLGPAKPGDPQLISAAFVERLEPTGFEPATFSLEGLVRPQTSPGEP